MGQLKLKTFGLSSLKPFSFSSSSVFYDLAKLMLLQAKQDVMAISQVVYFCCFEAQHLGSRTSGNLSLNRHHKNYASKCFYFDSNCMFLCIAITATKQPSLKHPRVSNL